MSEKPKIIVILGPTASGKSSLAVEIAKKFNGEIISADSRQVYKGFNLTSGKITKREMAGVPHYLLDVASPRKTFTAARYQKLAKKALEKILKKGKLPIICGGTGLYIDYLIYNYKLPNVPPNLKLRKKLEENSTAQLFKKLAKLDPKRAENIDRFNKRRLVRALEIALLTKKPVPPLKKNSPYQVLKIGIKKSPAELKKPIKKRLVARLKKGMIEEIKNLHRASLSWKKLDDFGLEYRYISRYLQGLISYDEMIKKLEREIYFYAKRQMTWFKRDKKIVWIKKEKEAFRKIRRFLLGDD